MVKVKYIWILLFLSAQFATLTGVQYGFFKVRQAHIRKEIKQAIKAGVPEDELVDFEFNIHDEEWLSLEWTKPAKEFRFNLQMYDVVEKTTKGNFVFFKCIHDVKESGLFQQLDLMTNNRSQRERSIVVFWTKQLYTPLQSVIKAEHIAQIQAVKEGLAYQQSLFHLFQNSPVPPPPEI